MRYRSDIDGLRAVAIIPIIFYHAGFSQIRGGYIGVDVFFVISGFLITKIVTNELDCNEFSLIKFFQKRVARIFPALFAMLAFVSIAFPPVLMLPNEIKDLFLSVASSSGFASNLYFLYTTDYFSKAAELQPLLHTWSLGVEEQFYILFPPLLILICKFKKSALLNCLVLIASLSFLMGMILHEHSQSGDFYLLPTRAWELVLGAIVAITANPISNTSARSFLAVAGAGLISLGMLFLPSWMPFPSPLAIIPAVGAALIIAFGEGTMVGRLLSQPILRWVGKISFSLYLWHWPIITLYRLNYGTALDYSVSLLLICASFVIASLSYYFIEVPSQRWLRSIDARKCVLIGLSFVGIFTASGIALHNQANNIWPVSSEATRVSNYTDYVNMEHDVYWKESAPCFIRKNGDQLNSEHCLKIIPTEKNILLLGDSHANMYAPSFRRQFPHVNFLQATHFGCAPIVGESKNWSCASMVDSTLESLMSSNQVDMVILASRWRANQAAGLARTISLIKSKGMPVTVIGPVPEYQGPFPYFLAREIERGTPNNVKRFFNHNIINVDRIIKNIAEKSGATYISAYDTICSAEKCILMTKDGTPAQFDYGHLTVPAADLVVSEVITGRD